MVMPKTNLRSENFASWFFMTAEQFLISPPQLSSFPHFTLTSVPSGTSYQIFADLKRRSTAVFV